MSGTGVNYADLVPVPEKTHAVTNPDEEEESLALEDGETASHAIATSQAGEVEEVGLAQQAGAANEVKNLGWNKPKENIPAPLVGGMDNEELWMLVRRFNKQVYHVKETKTPVPGNLDLNIADEDEFSPDKLRSTSERLYMTIGIGMIGFAKHVGRLRSWKEQRRTSCFAAAYFIAWIFDMIIPLLCITFIVFIAFPPSRKILFPPAPLALVDAKTGGIQKPPAGVLGSSDSATGAPEHYKGEAVEQEASNFVSGLAHVTLSSAAGKQTSATDDTDIEASNRLAQADALPDPAALALGASNARDTSKGTRPDNERDKTKQPMEAKMWMQMRPLMHGLQDAADTWERFGNALSPTAPFPRQTPRLRLASLVVPLLAVSLAVNAHMFVKSFWFGIGFAFFGDPVITPGLTMLNEKFPNWQDMLQPRNTILKGIPTNAQLTITLLRIGEYNKSPLPPPPSTHMPPPDRPVDLTENELDSVGGDLPMGASKEEIEEAVMNDPSTRLDTTKIDDDVSEAAHTTPRKRGAHVLAAAKASVRAGVESALGADRVRATVGSSAAKNRIGAIPPQKANLVSGPVEFRARYKGKKGHVYISVKATTPCVAFTSDSRVDKIGTQGDEDLHPAWSVAVGEIQELRKIGGFGWKTKIVIGWSLGREVVDALDIVDKRGNKYRVTACPLRDELFNRLIAMGGQKWESW